MNIVKYVSNDKFETITIQDRSYIKPNVELITTLSSIVI